MLIAERIGDTVEMINNIYGHLYPNRHEEVADKLEQLVSKHKEKARNPLILKVSGFSVTGHALTRRDLQLIQPQIRCGSRYDQRYHLALFDIHKTFVRQFDSRTYRKADRSKRHHGIAVMIPQLFQAFTDCL